MCLSAPSVLSSSYQRQPIAAFWHVSIQFDELVIVRISGIQDPWSFGNLCELLRG